MSRGRGRPAGGAGLTLDDILNAGLALLDEGGEQGLSMRALAARLGVTPMSLYNHVPDRAGLLRVLSDRMTSMRSWLAMTFMVAFPMMVERRDWAVRSLLNVTWLVSGSTNSLPADQGKMWASAPMPPSRPR